VGTDKVIKDRFSVLPSQHLHRLASACFASVCTVQFSSVQDGIYVLEKVHKCLTPSIGIFPNVAFEMVPMFVRLTMALSRPFKQNPLALPQSSKATLLQAIDGVMSLASRPQPLTSQAPQHFSSSDKQALCAGCFARHALRSFRTLQTPDVHLSIRDGPTTARRRRIMGNPRMTHNSSRIITGKIVATSH